MDENKRKEKIVMCPTCAGTGGEDRLCTGVTMRCSRCGGTGRLKEITTRVYERLETVDDLYGGVRSHLFDILERERKEK